MSEVKKTDWVIYATTRVRLKVVFDEPKSQTEAEDSFHYGEYEDIIDEEYVGDFDNVEAEDE